MPGSGNPAVIICWSDRAVRKLVPPVTSAVQFVQRDGQLANTLASGVIDRVADRGRYPDDAYLADAFDAERIAVVLLIDKDDFDVVNVRVHRHMVFNICIDDTTELVIDLRLFVQRHADTPDHAAEDLAVCGLGVQDTSCRDG